MKVRPQPFACAIAGKTVAVALRRGGGLTEPSKVYVRCDERDCQYVDFNTAPCPLRVEMFTDGSDRRVAEYLSAHAGRRFCYACLTVALELTHDQIRRASWGLIADRTFSIGPSRCIECWKRRMTIGFAERGNSEVAGVALVTQAADLVERLGTYLRARSGFWLCVHCLARELGAKVSVVRAALSSHADRSPFSVRTGQCVSCLLVKQVLRYETEVRPTGQRVIDFLRESPDVPFCAACIAFACDIALSDAKAILADLGSSGFEWSDAACSVCSRWQRVVWSRLETGR
jgi:hypothetical protein